MGPPKFDYTASNPLVDQAHSLDLKGLSPAAMTLLAASTISVVAAIALLATAPAASVAIAQGNVRGGFGEQEPGVDYNVEDPLFDFNVLVTGAHTLTEALSRGTRRFLFL